MKKKAVGPAERKPQLQSQHSIELNRGLSIFLGVSVAVLLAWIAYLAISLPRRYDAGHWDLLWVGFDIALFGVLIVAAHAAWFRRRILNSISIVAGTLLFCDAWFDVVTSWGNRDSWVSVVTALGVEIPMGIMFFWVARRFMLRQLALIHLLSGLPGPSPRLRDANDMFAALSRQAMQSNDEHQRENPALPKHDLD